jgi:ribosomal protein S18 acetylase RimI-like enzyme
MKNPADRSRGDGADAATPEISPLRPGQVGAAAEVLARSFLVEPVYRHLLPDHDRALRALRHFLAAPLRDAISFGTAYVATEGEAPIGASAWLPPGAYPWGPMRKLRAMPAMLRAALAAPSALPGLMRLGANVEREFPERPVWYLQVVGVDPGSQGRRVGTGLVEPGLARADADRCPCYLETSRPENLRFYERLGFRVGRGDVELLPGGPTHWTMWRTPASGPESGHDRGEQPS